MSAIANNIAQLIGNTPLLKLNRLNPPNTEIIVKLESRNPGGSAKDRIAMAMIAAGEESGILKPGGTIIEPTSGNTGVGLAMIAAARNYKLILTMPDTMSIERRKLLKAYGAELILTPGAQGMSGAIAKAQELHLSIPNSFIPQQFENPANPEIHQLTTGEEIWRDTDGRIDAFVAGVGTGGSLTGAGRALRSHNPEIMLVAVEPADSAVLSGNPAAPHKLQGIGAGFIPRILDKTLIDRIIPVSTEDAGRTARNAAKQEGLLIGISGGAALFAALELAKTPEMENCRIVVLIPDSGERYLSTWLFEE